MRQLIVNADDFGRHQLINRAVEECVRRGCLRSATLMAGGAAFQNAVEIARRNPSLGVGIHFTLVNGNPILPPQSIPSLVTSNGKFHDSYTEFLTRLVRGEIIFDEIRAELAAQLDKVKRTGLRLTHFDSHQHLHHIPKILGITLNLAKSVGIRAMRSANAGIFDGEIGGIGQLIGRIGLSSLAKLATFKAHSEGFVTPNHFAGIVAGEAVNEQFIANLIDNLKDGATEIMLHPGVDNSILQDYCRWNHDFEAEMNAVISPAILQKLRDKKIAAVNFAALIN